MASRHAADSIVRLFVECPWGTEWLVAEEIAAAVAPLAVGFGPVVPPRVIAASANGSHAQPRCPPASGDATFAAITPIPGILLVAVTLPAQGAPDAAQGEDDEGRRATLRRLGTRIRLLRSVEALHIFIGQGTAIANTDDIKGYVSEPAVLAGVERAMSVARAMGTLDPYVPTIDLAPSLVTTVRPFGGALTKKGKQVKETAQEQDSEEVAKLNDFLTTLSQNIPTASPSLPDDSDGRSTAAEERVVFRVTPIRMDKQVKTMTSHDIGDAVGLIVGDAFPDWHVSMRLGNTDFLALHRTDILLLGVRAHQPNVPRGGTVTREHVASELQRRAMGQAVARGELSLNGVRYAAGPPAHFKDDVRQGKGENAMNPALAHFLVRLANPQPGEVLLDPMAGTGTVPMETALVRGSGAIGIGGDIELSDVGLQRDNYEYKTFSDACGAFGVAAPAAAACFVGGRWTATKLPLRPACVDAVITDLPFGKRCGNSSINAKLYPALISEFARVVRPGGRAVLLTIESELVLKLVGLNAEYWECVGVPQVVDMNGLKPLAFVLQRSGRAFTSSSQSPD